MQEPQQTGWMRGCAGTKKDESATKEGGRAMKCELLWMEREGRLEGEGIRSERYGWREIKRAGRRGRRGRREKKEEQQEEEKKKNQERTPSHFSSAFFLHPPSLPFPSFLLPSSSSPPSACVRMRTVECPFGFAQPNSAPARSVWSENSTLPSILRTAPHRIYSRNQIVLRTTRTTRARLAPSCLAPCPSIFLHAIAINEGRLVSTTQGGKELDLFLLHRSQLLFLSRRNVATECTLRRAIAIAIIPHTNCALSAFLRGPGGLHPPWIGAFLSPLPLSSSLSSFKERETERLAWCSSFMVTFFVHFDSRSLTFGVRCSISPCRIVSKERGHR